jgi:hypothetical protein
VSPPARPESSPTPLLQTSVRQLRKLSLRLLPVVHHGRVIIVRHESLTPQHPDSADAIG